MWKPVEFASQYEVTIQYIVLQQNVVFPYRPYIITTYTVYDRPHITRFDTPEPKSKVPYVFYV